MDGIIITKHLIEEKNSIFVELIGRSSDGNKFIKKVPYSPFFYIRKEDTRFIRKPFLDEKKVRIIDENLKNFSNEPVVKLEFNSFSDYYDIEKDFLDAKLKCYESDVNSIQSFMIDKNLGTIIFFDDLNNNSNVSIVDNISIEKIKTMKKLFSILSLDIETDYNTNKIISVSISYKKSTDSDLIQKTFFLCDNDYFEKSSFIKNRNLTRDSFNNFLVESFSKNKIVLCSNENELISSLRTAIIDLDPDIITGWNVIDFDINILKKRAELNNTDFRIGLDNSDVKIFSRNNFWSDSSAKTKGRQILDGLSLIKQSYVRLDDYKLDTAAKVILGDKKISLNNKDVSDSKGDDILDLYYSNPVKLIEYNLKDTTLVLDIIAEKSLLDIAFERSLITGLELDRVKSPVATMESLYIKEAHKRGFVLDNIGNRVKLSGISGGFVLKSKPGLYNFVLVFDYKSLYPSIIRTFNIDLLSASLSLNNSCVKKIKSPNDTSFCIDEKGILPVLIEKIWALRDQAKKEKDLVKSYAMKITLNSLFGVLANPNCRYFNYNVADSITSFGRKIIQMSVDYLKEKNYEVIYGDTDSLFLLSNKNSVEDAERLGNKLVDELNSFFEKYVSKNYSMKSILQLEFEKIYLKFMMPRVRNQQGGAKKRYAGLLLDENNTPYIDIKGMEFVRSDWTDLAKEFQYSLLDSIFNNKPYEKLIEDTITSLKSGKLDEKLVYRKKLTKPLEEYNKTTPPHVKAARLLPEIKTNIIKYYMTKSGPIPVQLFDKKTYPLDYEHYITKQLKPVADTILALLGKNFDDLLKSDTQNTLLQFTK